MTTKEENIVEEKKSISFVEQLVEQDLAEGKTEAVSRLVSPLSLTDICI